MTELVYNPYAFSHHDDPYETYARLRGEAPVYRNDELDFWALSRFADVQEAFRDHATFSSAGGIALEQRAHGPSDQFRQMIEMDPPAHTPIRRLVSRVFSGRKVAEMEGQIRQIVKGYLDAAVGDGEMDLVSQFTAPFPMDVISAVLGIPEDDRAELRSFADQILIREDGKMEIPDEALEGMFALLGYFIDDLPRRKAGEGTGLISDLVTAEVEGRALTDEELLGFCVLFVIAGHETTTKMVANSVELLGRHPTQKAKVIDRPELVPDLVEEVLRFHNSTQYMVRQLTRDHTLHGVTMGAGDYVVLLIGAANHDHDEFGPTADQFLVERRPERHLAFGYGAHFCLGAALARMEGRIALEEIHRRIPDYEVDHDAKVRFHSGNVTGWTTLPVRFAAS